ncbi:MAG: hypothetical protein ACRECP_11875 [Methylocella sp.]
MSEGITPAELMKGQGYVSALLALLKYNPDEPRVPAGSGRESGEWTSGDGGGTPPQHIVRRVEIGAGGATMSDANSPGIVAGAQYAQLSPTPILTQDRLEHIDGRHGTEWKDPTAGRFIGRYATEDGIRELITAAWNEATPADLAANEAGRVLIAASSYKKVDGEWVDDDVGYSGDRTKIKELTGEFGTSSVKTNLYVVILDSDMRVITCFPINPLDLSVRPERY